MDDDARRIEKEVALPATPEQVWEAIATGPGISAWYVPHEIFPGEGGLVSLGPGLDGRVLVWQEGERFAYGRFPLESPDQPDYLYDFRIAAVSANGEMDEDTEDAEDATEEVVEEPVADEVEEVEEPTAESEDTADEAAEDSEDSDDWADEEPETSVLTFVQSGFPEGEEWDAEFASYDQGWDLFLGNLTAYLTHFPGEPGAATVAGASPELSAEVAWTQLVAALNVEGELAVEASIELKPEGPEEITGTVDAVVAHQLLGIRTENGLHRFAVDGDEPCTVSIYHYLYGEEVADEEVVDQLSGDWQDWLDELFPLTDDELDDEDEEDEAEAEADSEDEDEADTDTSEPEDKPTS
ncbi:SRPBCC family protein [Tenggerimyces flavus]|uniref:SRPBCC domain-containing protein n=1 Tax=Tenggerimyces flavus TaxID=1708749 RepID=A0ABV7YC34_9ACTN|nr:SRPBCC domain-containing protein [Tenggerimyces flavus]MBM7786985.1 uncharacterized protein YndB with AHSA1/START domain [Tenggerimyces flavus]